MIVGQNQWYHFGVGAPPILDYFSGDWDVHWGYRLLTHGHIFQPLAVTGSGYGGLGGPPRIGGDGSSGPCHGRGQAGVSIFAKSTVAGCFR